MRFTRFSGIAATAALSAATVLGGAGIAQAQSLGSLTAGSSAPAPLVLNPDEAGTEAANGTLTNNTEDALECTVLVGNSDAVAAQEAALADDDDHAVELTGTDLIATESSVTVPANETEEWDVTYTELSEDPVAGAVAYCGDAGADRLHAFDYEPAGTGSLSNIFGSLGSSDAEADDAGNADADNDTESTGSLSSLTAGSSNDDANTPA